MARGATQRDTESEYFVHPSEGPNSLTVSPKSMDRIIWLGKVPCNVH